MKNKFKFLALLLLFVQLLSAQSDRSSVSLERRSYISPLELNLEQEAAEVTYYAHWLGLLKEAYAANDMGKVISYESAVMMGLRTEINQLELKVASETAQTERRKSASSGQIVSGSSPDDAPARDPLADPVTPDEVRLETMQYTLAAFERHAFDPADPAAAARDFEKLDKILVIMQEALAELQAIRK